MERCDGGLLDDGRYSAWLNLMQTHSVVSTRMEAGLAAAVGLSLAEHEVLIRLAQTSDRQLRMQDLSSLLLLSKSGITRVIDRLEKRGLVIRKMSETDRRVILAALTDDGIVAMERARPAIADGIEEFFSRHLTDKQISELRALLRKILDGNGEWSQPRCDLVVEAESVSA